MRLIFMYLYMFFYHILNLCLTISAKVHFKDGNAPRNGYLLTNYYKHDTAPLEGCSNL